MHTNVLDTGLNIPASDKRKYLYTVLSNQLRCLIISDSDTDKSAAALSVKAGALQDPKTHYGLAHFCEHMLFMGTEKYPNESEFSDYLNVNSGFYNAYTDQDHTNYHYEVSNDAFIGSLDRFSQFFKKPLFIKDTVGREMQAVDSEHKNNLQSDAWRFMQLQRHEAHPDSVFNCFATGDINTLNKPDTREKLLEFHEKYYSSNVMGLVVLSNTPAEELLKVVVDLFTEVPLKEEVKFEKNYMEVIPYDSRNLKQLYKVIPVEQKNELYISWYLQNFRGQYYKSNPLRYLSSILGHEGPNSILSSLIKDDLANGLESGYECVSLSFTDFYVKIELTEKGLDEWEKVLTRVIYMVKKLQANGPSKAYFEECKEVHKLDFDYKNKETPFDYVSDLSPKLLKYDRDYILSGDKLFEDYDENLLKSGIEALTLENLNVYLVSQELEEEMEEKLEEPIYKTIYTREKLPSSVEKLYKKNIGVDKIDNHLIDLPPKNPFIPKSFEIIKVENETKYPTKVFDDGKNVIWHKQDYTFNLPKVEICLQIYFDYLKFNNFCEYEVLSHLWKRIVKNELREVMYMAEEAKTEIKLKFNSEGIIITVSGFSDGLKSCLHELFKKIKEIDISGKEDKIATQLEFLSDKYSNFYLKDPYEQATNYLEVLLKSPSAEMKEKIDLVEKLEEDESNQLLVSFVNNYLKSTRFEWVVQGNIHSKEAIEMCTFCQDIIQVNNQSGNVFPSLKIVDIPPKTNFFYVLPNENPDNLNSSIISYFQVGNQDLTGQLKIKLLVSIFGEAFFDDLRTKQSLGYITQHYAYPLRKVSGLKFLVQSSAKSPEYIWEKISEFVLKGQETLRQMSDDDFIKHVKSVKTEVTKKDVDLQYEIYRNYAEIKNRDFAFDKKEKFSTLIETIVKTDLQAFYEEFLILNPKRIDVEVVSEQHRDENSTLNESNYKFAEDKLKCRRIELNEVKDLKEQAPLYKDFMFG